MPESSSQTRMVPSPRGERASGGLDGIGGASGAGEHDDERGWCPAPRLRCAQMEPLCCWTMVRQMARPRPVPPFWRASEGSTCWKRSKMESSLSAGMPRPSSETLSRMESAVASA